jgi:predicted transcriptional regulator
VVGEVMDEAFPVVDAAQHVESVQKLLSKATPAVLVREAGAIHGIITRSDMLAYLMAR